MHQPRVELALDDVLLHGVEHLYAGRGVGCVVIGLRKAMDSWLSLVESSHLVQRWIHSSDPIAWWYLRSWFRWASAGVALTSTPSSS